MEVGKKSVPGQGYPLDPLMDERPPDVWDHPDAGETTLMSEKPPWWMRPPWFMRPPSWMREHPDESETTLMNETNQMYEKPPWCMSNHPDSWDERWKTLLDKDHPSLKSTSSEPIFYKFTTGHLPFKTTSAQSFWKCSEKTAFVCPITFELNQRLHSQALSILN